MQLKKIMSNLVWIIVVLVGASFIRTRCSRSYDNFAGNFDGKVENVQTVTMEEALNKAMVDVTTISADAGRAVRITFMRRGDTPFVIRATPGLHTLPSGSGRSITVRVDTEFSIGLASSSSASATLPVVQ